MMAEGKFGSEPIPGQKAESRTEIKLRAFELLSALSELKAKAREAASPGDESLVRLIGESENRLEAAIRILK